ncbi:MAG: DEAD/DEAH box helicase [Lachnospiraceae bacterium]|nr:DEAD/DEAH box helicase [Lachnospiraceae bacterium]
MTEREYYEKKLDDMLKDVLPAESKKPMEDEKADTEAETMTDATSETAAEEPIENVAVPADPEVASAVDSTTDEESEKADAENTDTQNVEPTEHADSAQAEASVYPEGSLDALGIDHRILKAVRDMGFDSASSIQEQAIPVELAGHDMVGQAQTGTGKTAAFGIPMLMKVDPHLKKLQGIILCPTRELAIQVSEELHRYAKYMHGVRILPVYGGQDIVKQIRGLKDGVQIMVGTPGRVMDHMRRGTVKFDHVSMIVLDEADEMLDMGFIDDMRTILSDLPEDRQTVMFSATMPKEIRKMVDEFQTDPVMVKVARKELTVPEITQYYYDIRPSIKTEVLCRLIDLYEPKLSVVFCNMKKKVDELTDELKARGYYAEGLHGDLTQSQRDRVMKSFRTGRVEILVATDVMARGIDVEDIEAVFNYDIPQDNEYYVHRIGRTGRAGRKGRAFSLVVGRDIYKLRDIQRFCKTHIQPQPVPSLNDISNNRTNRVLDEAVALIENEPDTLKDMQEIIDQFIFDNDSSSMELAAALLKLRLGSEPETEDDLDDLSAPRPLDNPNQGKKKDGDKKGRRKRDRDEEKGSRGKKGKKKKYEDDDMVRLFINIGKNQRIKPGDLVGAIAGEADIPGRMVGAIDLYDSYSFVDVDRQYAEQVMHAMRNVKIRGLKVRMEKAL